MDQQIVITLYNLAASQPSLTHLDVFIAERGIFLLPLALILLWFWPGRRGPIRRQAVLACGLAFILTVILIAVMDHATYRPRPFVELDLTPLFPHADDTSFPSDHTLLGVVLTAPLLWRQRRVGILLFFWTLIVGFARVTAGVHYPSDILGSALLALVPATVGLLISRLFVGNMRFLGLAENRRRW